MGNEPRGLTEVCLATLEAAGAGPSDSHLLRRYVAHRDQAAFAALVRRHGPMVLGLCRRITAHPHDAEDAFQATFLVLIRKAAAIRQPETIGNWLYGVAYRTARASRRRRAVRSVRETPWLGVPEPAASVATSDVDMAIVDEELRRLPEKYRTAVVLCDLEGRTRRDVARMLGVADGTLSDRLAAARQMLGNRLSQRGITLGLGAVLTALAPAASPAEAAGLGAGLATPSPTVTCLAQGVLQAMVMRQVVLSVTLFVTLLLVATGAVAWYRTGAAERGNSGSTLEVVPAADDVAFATSRAFTERQIGFQKFLLLTSVKVRAQKDAQLDMVYATGNPRSFLPRAIVEKIDAPIVDRIDITEENETRASLGLSGVNPKDQVVFDVARIDAWDLGVGPPGKQLDLLVIDHPEPGYGVVGRDWMVAASHGDAGLIADSWKVYFGRLITGKPGEAPRMELVARLEANQNRSNDADDVADVPSKDLRVGGDSSKRYFLIGPSKDEQPADAARERGLIVVLPGGDGGSDFHSFVKRLFKHSAPPGYLMAQPIAVKWTPNQQIVWPTDKNKVPAMKFTTEAFVDAVIADVSSRYKIDAARVFTLSWSSGGPAGYATGLTSKKVTGSFVAMSVFNPTYLPPLTGAKDRAFYLYHSPDDRTCPYRMATNAVQSLKGQNAKVELKDYAGGHGWRGGLYDDVRTGIEWLEKNSTASRAP